MGKKSFYHCLCCLGILHLPCQGKKICYASGSQLLGLSLERRVGVYLYRFWLDYILPLNIMEYISKYCSRWTLAGFLNSYKHEVKATFQLPSISNHNKQRSCCLLSFLNRKTKLRLCTGILFSSELKCKLNFSLCPAECVHLNTSFIRTGVCLWKWGGEFMGSIYIACSKAMPHLLEAV